jgi:AraC family transcriptional regulator
VADLVLMSQALAFVERNLCSEIGVADMAGAVGYSLYHFCRTFNAAVHHTPYDYVVRRRLSEAARELVESDRRILDVALDYQFSSAETFSRAFKRLFAVQPSQWRKDRPVDARRCMPALTLAHLEHLARGDLNPILEGREAFHIAGVAGRVRERGEETEALWAGLARELPSSTEGATRRLVGLAGYGLGWEETGFTYLAGHEVPSSEVAHPAVVVKRIPPFQYARFVHRGPLSDLGLTLDYIYHTWLPKSGCRLAWPVEIEERRCFDLSPDDPYAETALLIPIEVPQPIPVRLKRRT